MSKSKSKRKLIVIIAACILLQVLLVSSVVSFFTDQQHISKGITVGDLTVDLVEKNFNHPFDGLTTDGKTLLAPNQIVPKDPVVKNTGTTDAIVFLKVEVPHKKQYDEGQTYDNTKEAEDVPLLKVGTKDFKGGYDFFDKHAMMDGEPVIISGKQAVGKYSSDWTLLSRDSDPQNYVFVFGYNQVLLAGKSTTALFDAVRLNNIDEGITKDEDLDMKITAYGVQADNVQLTEVDESLVFSDHQKYEQQRSQHIQDLHNAFALFDEADAPIGNADGSNKLDTKGADR